MEGLEFVQLGAIALAAVFSFGVSASAGLGGSLLLVPTLVLLLGPREGIALAAMLLAGNNVFKVFAYRRTIPLRQAAMIIVLVGLGAWVGAIAMVNAPPSWVAAGVIAAFIGTLASEYFNLRLTRRALAPLLALASGATSGFSGTSGPLKGAAIRNLGFDRAHFAGAASVASLVGDVAKTSVFAQAEILGGRSLSIFLLAIPLMVLGTASGFQMNRILKERGFAIFFWIIMLAYGIRVVVRA